MGVVCFICVYILFLNKVKQLRCLCWCLLFVAAVYLKNSVVKFWKERDSSELEENEQPFCIDDSSKAVVREHIVKAIIQTPPSIRCGGKLL